MFIHWYKQIVFSLFLILITNPVFAMLPASRSGDPLALPVSAADQQELEQLHQKHRNRLRLLASMWHRLRVDQLTDSGPSLIKEKNELLAVHHRHADLWRAYQQHAKEEENQCLSMPSSERNKAKLAVIAHRLKLAQEALAVIDQQAHESEILRVRLLGVTMSSEPAPTTAQASASVGSAPPVGRDQMAQQIDAGISVLTAPRFGGLNTNAVLPPISEEDHAMLEQVSNEHILETQAATAAWGSKSAKVRGALAEAFAKRAEALATMHEFHQKTLFVYLERVDKENKECRALPPGPRKADREAILGGKIMLAQAHASRLTMVSRKINAVTEMFGRTMAGDARADQETTGYKRPAELTASSSTTINPFSAPLTIFSKEVRTAVDLARTRMLTEQQLMRSDEHRRLVLSPVEWTESEAARLQIEQQQRAQAKAAQEGAIAAEGEQEAHFADLERKREQARLERKAAAQAAAAQRKADLERALTPEEIAELVQQAAIQDQLACENEQREAARLAELDQIERAAALERRELNAAVQAAGAHQAAADAATAAAPRPIAPVEPWELKWDYRARAALADIADEQVRDAITELVEALKYNGLRLDMPHAKPLADGRIPGIGILRELRVRGGWRPLYVLKDDTFWIVGIAHKRRFAGSVDAAQGVARDLHELRP